MPMATRRLPRLTPGTRTAMCTSIATEAGTITMAVVRHTRTRRA
jgi:hypothetical protein